MALISCPECDREVSSLADSCPYCGFPIGMINDVFSNQIGLSQKDRDTLIVVFFEMVTGYRELEDCLEDDYYESNMSYDDFFDWMEDNLQRHYSFLSANAINNTLETIENEEIIKHIHYKGFDEAVTVFVNEYREKINEKKKIEMERIYSEAENTYNTLIRKGEMGFGVLTNSFIGASIYAFQSSVKEAKAKEEAENAKYRIIERGKERLEEEIDDYWKELFEHDFVNGIARLHLLYENYLETVIFEKVAITWKDVQEWIEEQLDDEED